MSAFEERFFKLRSNKMFETFVIGIIIFSALVIGVKTYDVPPLMTRLVVILDWFITFFFLVEITIRFLGEPNKRDFFKNGWNVFDTVIVVVSIVPIDNSQLAVVGRLIRIFRVLRMVSIVPELRLLVNSLLRALPQLSYVMVLMFIIFYIYAAVGSTFFKEINPVLWGDIAVSMLTLFRVMTFEDWTDVMYETQKTYGLSWMYYLSFIFFTAFAFLNMVIGIIVNVLEQERRKLAAETEEVHHDQYMEALVSLREEMKDIKTLLKKDL